MILTISVFAYSVFPQFEREEFDVVYHIAAYAAEGLSHFIRNYNYQNNLIATTNLITQSIRNGNVKKFVFTSSIAVYGSGRPPMTEDMEPLPEDPYGISKLACEYDLKAAHAMFGLDYVIFRPHNVYGPGQIRQGKMATVIGIFEDCFIKGKALPIVKPGTQSRRFTHIKDTVEVCFKAWKANKCRYYSISNNTSLTIIEVAKLFNSKIKYLSPRKGERYASALSGMSLNNKVYKNLGKIQLKDYIFEFLKKHT